MAVSGQVLQSQLPASVVEALDSGSQAAQAVIDGPSATCALHLRGEALFFQATGGVSAEVLQRGLPYSSEGCHHLAIVPNPDLAEVTFALCSQDGNLTVWTDMFSEDAPMLTHRLSGGKVTAFAAAATPGWVYLAAAADDGSVYIVQGQVAEGEELGTLSSRTLSSTAAPGTELSQGYGRLSRVRIQRQRALTVQALPGAATSLQLFASDPASTDLTLLALTEQGINCYQVGSQTDTFLWSTDIRAALTAGSSSQACELKALAVTPAATSIPRRIAVLAGTGSNSMQTIAVAALPSRGAFHIERLHEVQLPGSCQCMLANPLADAFLLWGGSQQPSVWTQAGTKTLSLPPCLAAALSADASRWLLLLPNAVASMPVKTGPASPIRSYHPQTPRTLATPQQQQHPQSHPGIKQESPSSGSEASEYTTLDASVAHGSVDRAARLLETAIANTSHLRGLYSKLEAAGAFSGSDGSNPVAVFSSSLVNALPKHWLGTGDESSAAKQLQAKLASHEKLLRTLKDCGALQVLPASSVRVIFEGGEKAEAMLAVRNFENDLLAKAQDASMPAGSARPTQECVKRAGRSARPQVSGAIEEHSDWELCFSRPAATAPDFLSAIADACGQLPADRPSQAMDELTELAEVLQAAMEGAHRRRQKHRQLYAEALQAAQHAPGPGWTCDTPSLVAHIRLVDALVTLAEPLQADDPSRTVQRAVELSLVAERTLDVLAASSGSVLDRQAATDIRKVYANEKDAIMGCLYGDAVQIDQHEAASEARDRMADLPGWEGTQSQTGPWLLERLETLAVQHQGYAVLTQLCELNNDRTRLHEHMLRSLRTDVRPAPGGENLAANCAEYVYGYYRDIGRMRDLLQLPDEFNASVSRWLDQQEDTLDITDLRAKHALRCGQYMQAGRCYRTKAQSGQQLLPAAQQSLVMSRLCALASAPSSLTGSLPPQVSDTLRHLEAEQTLAQVQHELFLYDREPLPPLQLATEALQSSKKQDAAQAFDVLAAAGEDFRLANKEMVESAWKACVTKSDCRRLARQAGSMSDQEMEGRLADTPLAAAAAKCYAPEPQLRSFCLGPSFESMFPLLQTRGLLETWAGRMDAPERHCCFQAFQLGAGAIQANAFDNLHR